MSGFIKDLTESIKSLDIIFDPILKQTHETDWRNKYHGKSLFVIFPKNTNDVKTIVKLCSKHNIKIVPQGGNTSTCGASVPINNNNISQIIVNLSKMNKIIEVDTENNSITVEAGCTLQQVINESQKHNLYFPLKIASQGSCQIGGNISTNAGGIHVMKYGTMRDLTLGLEAILPNGESINQLHKLRKNNTNFDFKQLFIGSEGTLGIITKAVLKLFPVPIDYTTMMIGLDTINHAITILNTLKLQNIYPSAFEIINDSIQNIYNKYFSDKKIPITSKWVIICEIESNLNFDAGIIFESLRQISVNLNNVLLASNEDERQIIWSIRETIPIAEKIHGIALKYDISLPISNIPSFIETNKNNLQFTGLTDNIQIFGHLGDGNLHYNIPLPNELSLISEIKISEIVYTDLTKLGGSISAEHGIGQLKKEWFKKFYDSTSYKISKSIKELVDPINIFNPGKIF